MKIYIFGRTLFNIVHAEKYKKKVPEDGALQPVFRHFWVSV